MSERITSKKMLGSFFWAYSENFMAQVVSFLVTIVLARLLSPNDYATIALVTVFINIANVFVSSSFSMALVQKKDADCLDYNTVFWFDFFISIILYFILFLAAPYIGKYLNNELLPLILRILSIRIPLSAYNSVQTAYVSNKMIFKKSFYSTFFGTFLSGLIGIVLACCGCGVWALIGQSISNVLFNTATLMIIIDWKPRFEMSIKRLKSLVGFGFKLLATGLMFTGYSELRTIVIGKRYSSEDLGYYNRGSQFPQFIASNIDSTITKVMFPALSKVQDSKEELKQMTRRSAKTSAYIMTPILFGLAVIADNLVSLLLTDKWLPCVPYLQIMCIVWWLQPTQSCSIQAIKAIGKANIYLTIEIISKIMGIFLLVVSLVVFNTPFAIAFTTLLGQAFAMLLYGAFVQHFIGYKMVEQFKDLFVPGLMGLVMAVLVWSVSHLIASRILLLMAQIILGGIVYLSLSILFKVEEFTYLKSLVFKIRKDSQDDTTC